MVPENQSADKKGLRASLRGVKTGSNPSTITALAENAVVKTALNQ